MTDLFSTVTRIQYKCNELEILAHQTVAHRRKFQFLCSQFHDFANKCVLNCQPVPVTTEQNAAFRVIISTIHDCQNLFGQHTRHCWGNSVLSNSSSTIATEVCTYIANLREATACIDLEASKSFNPDSPQWLQYHLLDLRAISSSFIQFLDTQPIDDPARPVMEKRLNSYKVFIKQFEKEDITPGMRMFSPIPINVQNWKLKHTDLEMLEQIGKGVSATVFFGRDLRTQEEVAIKKLKFKKLDGQQLQSFQREIGILATAIHPTILRFIGATETSPLCVVTEWMPNNSLYHDIHRHKKMNQTQRTIAAFDIARGLNFLHSRQIIHRDLKSLNILLDKDFRIRICDFGFSRKVEQGESEYLTKNIGTPHWMAPELFAPDGTYDLKVDVYAYGVVLWELASQSLPYQGLDSNQIIGQVLMNDIRPTIPQTTPLELRNLIEQCWTRDPSVRPTFQEIIDIFYEGRIFLEGADTNEVMEYIESIPQSEDQVNTKKIRRKMSTHDADVISTFEQDGIPPNLVEECWNSILQIDPSKDPKYFSRGCICFLSTAYASKASEALRKLPRGAVPNNIVLQALENLPTGQMQSDTDLIVFACKHGCHAQAILHVIDPLHIKLVLETCAKKGVDENNKEAVVNACIRYLDKTDTMVIVAAFRCLVGIKMTSKIPIDKLKLHMQSRTLPIKAAAYIAAAEMAENGLQLPSDLIDTITSKWASDQLAMLVAISSCSNIETARILLNRLEFGAKPPPEIIVRMFYKASQHNDFKSDLIENIHKYMKTQNYPDITRAINSLLLKIDH